MDIRHVGDRECISCGDCVNVCPTKAITWKGPKFLLPQHQPGAPAKTSQIIVKSLVASLMVALLIGAFAYFWNDTPDLSSYKQIGVAQQTAPTEELVVGNQVGNLCPEYTIETVTAEGVAGEIDPSKTGKITVINFWGTWCGPCVAELPHFDELAENHADEVTVIAVHSALERATAPEFIAENYPESNIIFAQDRDSDLNGEYYDLLGGIGAFPYTVVLDERGVITAAFPSSVTYADLEEAVTGSRPQLPPVGNQVGNLCPEYVIETVTAQGVAGEIDPSKTGKITVINFWGTWCGPCVAELPHFAQLAENYADDVTVIAVHSALARETAPNFIEQNYLNSKIIFAQDRVNEVNGEYYDLLGGIGAFPYTVVLDERGVIIASFPSSVTYEDLEGAVTGH